MNTFLLGALPYAHKALEPYISEKTLSFHHGKHHQGYVTKMNELMQQKTEYAGKTLVEIVEKAMHDKDEGMFNQAAQVWNHDFYWASLCPPEASQRPTSGALYEAICHYFGSVQALIDKMVEMGMAQFASGWVWLARTKTGELVVLKTSNAQVVWPEHHPLMIWDVWEHAYYLDQQNKRKDYLESTLHHLINWTFVEKQFLGTEIFQGASYHG